MQDYYEILGVPRFSEDTQEFRRAYKEQVLFFHPDKGNVNKSIALERTQLLNEAYKTLKDPAKKADYDRALKAFLQRESYAAQEKKKEERPKPAYSQIPDNPAVAAIKKAAEKAMTVLPVLPKPVLVMIAIVVLLCTVTFIDMIYRAASGIVSPSEIDSGIFASGDDRNDVSFRVKVIVL
ncbi:MAG: J domain-containing protein [Firmicutes bacterium]|nr:J domain-containing protein [Bacillota bacterium]